MTERRDDRPSDHFDGKRFFNPHHQELPGFRKFLRMITSVRFQKWPAAVDNHLALNLNADLQTSDVALTFVNHATMLIQNARYNVLTDPVWSRRVSPVTWAGPKRVREPGIPFDRLPRIDVVVLSHNHYDHMDLATLKRLEEWFSPRFLTPLGTKKLLLRQGLRRVDELDWWQSVSLDEQTSISFLPTQHFSSRTPWDRNKTLWGSYRISFDGKSVYFGGDAGYSPYFKEIFERLGPTDVALLPIGAYEPRWFMKPVHMNPKEAVQAHLDLHARYSVGIHFGTFQLTEEAIDAPARDLARARDSANVPASSFVVLPEGVTTIYRL